MANKVDDPAASVAALTDDEVEEFERAVSGLRAERARAAEARIAGLRAMTDREVVDHYIEWRQAAADTLLVFLKEAGFVRGVTLEAAYSEGYQRGFYDAKGSIQDPDYFESREYLRFRDRDLENLDKLAREAAAA